MFFFYITDFSTLNVSPCLRKMYSLDTFGQKQYQAQWDFYLKSWLEIEAIMSVKLSMNKALCLLLPSPVHNLHLVSIQSACCRNKRLIYLTTSTAQVQQHNDARCTKGQQRRQDRVIHSMRYPFYATVV